MDKPNRFIVAIDFDGTIVEDKFPNIGAQIDGALDTIKRIKELGAEIILWTCRDDNYLDFALQYCERRGIVFDAINDNVQGLDFTPSKKIYANVYIDDRGNDAVRKSPTQMVQIWKEIRTAIENILGNNS